MDSFAAPPACQHRGSLRRKNFSPCLNSSESSGGWPISEFVAGILSIGGGSSLGREGPSVQLAGAVASNRPRWPVKPNKAGALPLRPAPPPDWRLRSACRVTQSDDLGGR